MTNLGSLGPLQSGIDAALERLTEERWAERLWSRDGTLWSSDPEEARQIAWWAGWLDLPQKMLARGRDFEIARQEMGARYDHVVLCGMGGSSLCPEVLRNTFGRIEGFPELIVLDSTDPTTIAAVEARIALDRTLFLIASKSGGTLETLSHYRYFHERMREAGVPHHSRQFVAITDEGSGLQKLAREQDFGFTFVNPEDVGGRYSALSFFGMVPAALMGLDQAAILASGLSMAEATKNPEARANPGLELGAVLGVAATSGRDKCTIICAPEVETLGTWLEQLLAESTGKEGRGIVPVALEPLARPEQYGNDRIFVYIRTPGSQEYGLAEALRQAGQPVYTIDIAGPQDLGAEFFRWEVGTAIAGAIIGINPFDQPNVQESKDNTRAVLQNFTEKGDFGVDLPPDPLAGVEALLADVRPGDYFAILAYTEMGGDLHHLLQRLRTAVITRYQVATTLGYGPRYLHSTGQLHKGGPNAGVYLVLSDERGDELPIPEAGYGFKTLIRAQWMGDLKSLRDHGRRVAPLPLGEPREEGLRRVLAMIEQATVPSS